MEHPQFLDHQGSKSSEPIDMKLDRGNHVGDHTPHANFGISTLKGARVHMRKIVIMRVYFLHTRYFYFVAQLHRSHRLIDLRVFFTKDVILHHLRPFWGANEKVTYCPLFFLKT